jgi:tetratricopeptide (TPR) repeat protein
MKRLLKKNKLLSLLVLFGLAACNANSPENKLLLADRFLEDKKYDAAISELQDLVDKSPSSQIGQEAQLKIARIQQLYLGRTKDAIFSYQASLKYNHDPKARVEIEKTLADLQFQTFENYENAVASYKKLIEENPNDPQVEHYLFNIGRALFFKTQFEDAIHVYEQLKAKFPSGKYAKKVDLEIGNALSSAGKCKEAIKQFEKVVQANDPETRPLAIFNQALCYEEQDDLDKAYELLASIKNQYPSPNVVELKMQKIKRRKILRKR